MISFLPVVVVDGGGLLFVDLESYGIVSYHIIMILSLSLLSPSLSLSLSTLPIPNHLSTSLVRLSIMDHGLWTFKYSSSCIQNPLFLFLFFFLDTGFNGCCCYGRSVSEMEWDGLCIHGIALGWIGSGGTKSVGTE